VLERAAAGLGAALLAAPLLAQDASQPQASVALEPDGPVTVGTPVEVSVTVLVPTYMPEPPGWPDLQVADAITRVPERATHPVTRRIGQESWSGITRTWEITPQRPADYDLGAARVTVVYADPASNAPVETTLDLPDVAFSAIVPPGAEGIDPFLAATDVTVTAAIDGPAEPKPGDAFTLTLTTTASGPPAILLPPLADRLPVPEGLRAYPRQPVIADGPPATRTEAVAYMIERPGSYVFPAPSIEWWDISDASRRTASAEALELDVPAPPGWHPDGAAGGSRRARALAVLAAGAAVAALAAILLRRHAARAPSARGLHRALRRSARADPPAAVRERLAAWQAALPRPLPPHAAAAIDAALLPLDRLAYGPPGSAGPEPAIRRELLRAIDAARPGEPPPPPALPALNPVPDLD
jgi:hypothetical protein